jgi:hypothetical protein
MAKVCGETTSNINPKWYDPLGPSAVGRRGKQIFSPTGAPQMRESIFNELTARQPGLMDSAANTSAAFRTAANTPGFRDATKLATDTIRGDYLDGSPQLDKALTSMRTASAAEGANAASRMRSQYQSNGLPWSTANQQAQQGAQTQATAQSNATEAQARLANYQQERANQMAATTLLDQSTGTPLQYLQMADAGELGPLTWIAQLISGLSGNGQIMKPDILQKQSIGRQFMAAAGEVI